ncbi:MAG: ribonuclease R [Minisyncoccia bacterium]
MRVDDEKIYQGPITVTRTGKGFFSIPDPSGAAPTKKPDRLNDLVIPREWLHTALPGDTVKVTPAGMFEDRKAGKVLEVVSRANDHFVGTLAKTERGNTILIPDSKKMYVPFLVAPIGTDAPFPLGHKVVVKFLGWDPSEEIPKAQAIEDIGEAGMHETEMRALALAQGFRSDFPPGVVSEAKTLEETGEQLIAKGALGRRDFRAITTFTIDPVDAKDFDDALSVRKLEDGNIEVGVHIADVSYFVVPGTAIDREARNRATSVYLVDRTIPMLPHVLSNNFCSLNPNVDRLSVSAVFVLDTNANIVDRWFGETVIHSAKRFTYEEAQGVLDAGSGTLYEELSIIRNLARNIRTKRVAKGAIEFDTAEVKVEIDADGKPVAIRLKERKETNLLIEDFMLLANEAVAEHLAKIAKQQHATHGLIYRVHDSPDADRIEDLSQFLKVMGYDLKTTAGNVKGVDLNALLEKVKGTPEEYLIKTATLRSMAKAVYTTKNVGHFGLAFDYYTHFTSPIRRYPDLLVHRMLKHYEHDQKIPTQELEEFDSLALHASEREVAAAEAERDSIKLKIVEFMADKIGQEFDAVISGVSDRGIYVELNETHAEGMIKIRDLGTDYFIHDQKRYRLVGERTKVEFALGDLIHVKLIAARVLDRELDFALVEKIGV